MNNGPVHILLAEDDKDDRLLFKEVLEELSMPTSLATVNDGEQLMLLLAAQCPSVLFLDLNMPRKNGFECLTEIKRDERLKELPVVIYSTSFDPEIVDLIYLEGAQYYIRKPSEFSKLKEVIHEVLIQIEKTISQPAKEKFILGA